MSRAIAACRSQALDPVVAPSPATAITLFGVTVVVFVLMRVVPGDPIAMMIPPGATDADIAALRAHYGLDLPIWQQFLVWFGQVLQGDFGTSISMKQNVLTIIARPPARHAGTADHRARHGRRLGRLHRAVSTRLARHAGRAR